MKGIVLQSPVGTQVTIGGRQYLYFGGTDYLGMANRPELREGAIQAIESYGISSSASRTSSGTTELHLELEQAISGFAGTAGAVLLSAGYLGMHALLSGLVEREEPLLLQQDAHSSIKEAAVAWCGNRREFDIHDLGTLRKALGDLPASGGRVILAGEGVSPLYGTIFPLNDILELLGERNVLVLVDDAHGFGVLGDQGRGTLEYHGCGREDVVFCSTLSKAFGSFGGCVPASSGVIEKIRRRSSIYHCATPPPAPLSGAALAAIRYVADNPAIVKRLKENAGLLKNGLAALGLPADNPEVPIAPVCPGRVKDLEKVSGRLFEDGILAPFSRYPGSPEGGMIRIAVTAAHSKEQIETLLAALRKFL